MNRTDVEDGDPALFYDAVNRKGAPGWSGPAKISDIDETAATAKFQSQPVKVARSCVRKKVGAKDAREVEWNPVSDLSGTRDELPCGELNLEQNHEGSALDEKGEDLVTGAGAPEDISPRAPRGIRTLDSPSLSAQAPIFAISFDTGSATGFLFWSEFRAPSGNQGRSDVL